MNTERWIWIRASARDTSVTPCQGHKKLQLPPFPKLHPGQEKGLGGVEIDDGETAPLVGQERERLPGIAVDPEVFLLHLPRPPIS